MKPVHTAVLLSVAVAVMVLVAVQLLRTGDGGGPDGQVVTFVLDDGGHLEITCEVADTSYERTAGLQFREDLPAGRGMLFVYGEPKDLSFIMPNMNFPLDIIFIAENGTVLNVEEAEPEDPDTSRSDYVRYRSDGEAKWVVEINQGLSRQHGIGPGTRVEIGPSS